MILIVAIITAGVNLLAITICTSVLIAQRVDHRFSIEAKDQHFQHRIVEGQDQDAIIDTLDQFEKRVMRQLKR